MMVYSDKIKALQSKAGIEADGVASAKTWLHVYYLLFNSVPYDLNTELLIKAIQNKIHVRTDGYPWDKTWDTLYDLLVDNKVENEIVESELDPQNAEMLAKMPEEVIPFAKELISMAARKGICIRLMDKSKKQKTPKKKLAYQAKFGLSFYVGVFEKNKKGVFVHVEKSPDYAKIGKLGEFIGLTYDHNTKYFNSPPKFEIVPAWAVKMSETEMVQELHRRKTENIKLLAIF